MVQAVETYDGWYAYHDFRKINWSKWKTLSSLERKAMLDELINVLNNFSEVENEHQGSFGQYAVLGHKADLLFIHLRPTMDELNEAKVTFEKTAFACFTSTPYSYISVVELSAYTVPPNVNPMDDPMFRERLQPILPKTEYVCFYPMNKRREGEDNWYTLSMEQRREMMKTHGKTGRRHAGKVKQIVTGSIGFDDWEWGVSLFANDPLRFKKLITEMRFDEVSARFGEFGSFYVGTRLTQEKLTSWLDEETN